MERETTTSGFSSPDLFPDGDFTENGIGGSYGIAHLVPSLVSCSSGGGNYCFQMFFS
ncbi:hypothetical protein M758_2G182900 [Ceratodon purpureus]|nr:hypothetical protein M758_2G182900 [Ceratodon purpureus]